jgi:hypothetical protein
MTRYHCLKLEVLLDLNGKRNITIDCRGETAELCTALIYVMNLSKDVTDIVTATAEAYPKFSAVDLKDLVVVKSKFPNHEKED